jgi:hypothetical protein
MDIKKAFLLLSFVAAAFTTGCFDAEVDEQAVPWSRPADWEGGAPGFGAGR